MDKKSILVTGCAGFIGYHTTKALLSRGVDVVGIDNLSDYYDIRLKDYRLKELSKSSLFHFTQIDFSDISSLEKIFSTKKFKAIIHLGGMAGVRYSMENPQLYMRANAIGTLNILDMMKKYDVKKIVMASTSSLYAGQKMPFSEKLPVNSPISPYASTKKAAEVMAYTYHHLYGIDVTVFRYFTVFGPAGRPDMSYFRFIKWINEGKPIELFGDGTQTRDFTYVDDIVSGTIAGLANVGYEIINLGGGKKPISINYMISAIEKLLDKKALINYKPMNKSDMDATSADIGKAKDILGWQPAVDFDEGIKRTVDWYIKNESMVSKIKV